MRDARCLRIEESAYLAGREVSVNGLLLDGTLTVQRSGGGRVSMCAFFEERQ